MNRPLHILVAEGRYYRHISDQLLLGAETALRAHGAAWEVIAVPGALEIPQVMAAALDAGLFAKTAPGAFDGFVALGCVIRGETSHYETVANESARTLMHLAVTHAIPLGNGILTVESEAQALTRAAVDKNNKGRTAVEACLEVIRVRRSFETRKR
jgi:6,7-dimethyl-8-ribityllumazine synthase